MSDFIVNPPSSSCSDGTTATGASVTSGVTYDGGSLSNIPASTNDNLNVTISNIDSRFLSLQNQVYDAAKIAQDGRDTANRVEGDLGSLQVDDISDPTTYTTLTPAVPNLEATLLDIDTRIGAVVSLTNDQATLLSLQPLFNKHVSKGFVFNESDDFDLSAVVGLSATIADGYVVSENGDIVNTTGEVKSFTANKDTYIYVNASTNTFTYKETSVGAGTPSSTDDEVILWKITTDASSITLQTDLREKKPIDESLFRAGTDVSNFIPIDSITNAKIDMSAPLQYDAAHPLTADAEIAHKKYVDDSVAALTTSVWTDATSYIYYTNTVGIGTSTPNTGTALHVDGTFRLTGSNHAAGKLLQSNSQGDASWVDVDLLTDLQATLNAGSTAIATSDVSITRDGASFDSILLLSDTTAKLEVTNGADSNKIEIQGGSMIVTDAINTKGLEYAVDYKDSFTTNSLVNKAYVDNAVAGAASYIGGYNASTNTPDLDTSPSGILKGHMYTVTADGTFYTVAVKVGDFLIAEVDNPSAETDWTIVEKNLDFGIANGNSLLVDGTPVATDYAKFTANGLEGRSATEVKTDLSLDNVENTALSTWAGSSNITTLGTINPRLDIGGAAGDDRIRLISSSANTNNYITWRNNANTTRRGYAGFTDANTFSIVNEETGTSEIILNADDLILRSSTDLKWDGGLTVTSSKIDAISVIHNTSSTTNIGVDVTMTTHATALNSYGHRAIVNAEAGGNGYGGFFQTSRTATGKTAIGVYGKVGGGDLGGVSYGGFHFVEVSGSNSSGGTIHGSKAQVTVNTTGTHTSTIYGVASDINYDKTGGVLGTAAGFYHSGAVVNTGTITSAYGIYLGDNTAGGTGAITNSYGVFQIGSDDKNYFAGSFEIYNTVKIESASDQQLFLDKDGGNYIRYRTAAGVNRGYLGYTSGGDFNIVNAESSSLNLYTNNTLSIEIDASSNVTVPNGRIISTSAESYPFRIEGTRQNVSYSFRDGVTLRAYMGYGEVTSTPSFNIQNNENSPIRLYTNGQERVKIEATGNVQVKEYIRIEQAGGTTPQANQFLKCTNGQGDAEWADLPASGVTGSGTPSFVPRFTSSSSIGSGKIQDNGSTVGINTAPNANYTFRVTTNATDQTHGIYSVLNQNVVSNNYAVRGLNQNTNLSSDTFYATGIFGHMRQTSNPASGTYAGGVFRYGDNTLSTSESVTVAASLYLTMDCDRTINTLYGIKIAQLENATGTVAGDAFGLYIAPWTGTISGTKYGIYQAGANDLNYFEGIVDVNSQMLSRLHDAGSTGAGYTFNFNNGNVQKITITASINFTAPINTKSGAVYTICVVQGGSAGYSPTWDSAFNWGSSGAPDLSIGTSVGDKFYITIVVNGSELDAIYTGVKH
jgi:hypothetical protein